MSKHVSDMLSRVVRRSSIASSRTYECIQCLGLIFIYLSSCDPYIVYLFDSIELYFASKGI